MAAVLLSRDEFRRGVFARDGNCCVICRQAGQDAHHIIERRLFPDGGYYIDNGATLCRAHHMDAETTVLSCEEIREAAGIRNVILPPHLYSDQRYDKWGNPILDNGRRLRGELFYDESVQKALGSVLPQFTHYVKYPRTWHLPWSPGATSDDRVIASADSLFAGRRVVVTAKLDGENTTFYSDGMHARSVDSKPKADRHWIINYHAKCGWQIPQGWRVCGENLYTVHQIEYRNLSGYFQVFSVWNEQNECLPWDDTVEWAQLLGFPTVPLLFDGVYDEFLIRGLYHAMHDGNEMEGYVIRLADGFRYGDFQRSVAKFVRSGHAAGSHGRRRGPMRTNTLATERSDPE